MCGIFGLIVRPSSTCDAGTLERTSRRLFQLSETRGKDACGALAVLSDRVEVLKSRERVGKLLKRPEFAELLSRTAQTYRSGHPYIVAGHTRMATNGTQDEAANNQPVVRGDHLLLHNGIIVNDAELWQANPRLERRHQVDTEVFAALMEQYADEGASLAAALSKAFTLIEGANTIAALRRGANELVAGTSNGSLYLAELAECQAVVFASEELIAKQAVAQLEPRSTKAVVEQVLPGNAVIIDIGRATVRRMSIAEAEAVGTTVAAPSHRALLETGLPTAAPRRAAGITNSLSQIERLMEFDWPTLGGLRRCTRCVLPESFPSIHFDEEGVCQFCRGHRPRQLKGEAALHALADRARSHRGGRDCLVPISGGRDSCYGLHYVKNELRLNPVAYTYDWGFVTDLARRNISRVCGRLGVEHVLVAADIRAKRENVRTNVAAWLKQPELGMIPLFMAGDKMFFYYASAIRRQMNLGPILFSMNWLERTGFKSAFAGVEESGASDGVSDKTYALGLRQQARMIASYARSFLTNPAYLNSSVFDTLFGFYAYYMRGKDYESIFDYLPWNQDEIVSTIISQYDWETSPDTQSTWRIGDGTAPFYNYIYLTICGFSEHDTFRSNQIRDGLITREAAMQLIESENRPRPDSFMWYCDTIGIDAGEALKVINRVPRRYERNAVAG